MYFLRTYYRKANGTSSALFLILLDDSYFEDLSNSMKKLYSISFILLFCLILQQKAFSSGAYFYQIKVYHLKTTSQEKMVDSFLKGAYLPALHRMGISKVGVFKMRETDTSGQLIYVFIPIKSLNDLVKIDSKLQEDKDYQNAGKEYLTTPYNNPAYSRLESIVLKAFQAMPEPAVPTLNSAKSERVYELRSYESATENLGLNKIGMFNDREVAMFTQLNFNAIFYGQVLSGSRMPNLMYMTCFNNKAERDKKWVDFGALYKTIKDLPQYLNNVSKANIYFLYPTQYSDF